MIQKNRKNNKKVMIKGKKLEEVKIESTENEEMPKKGESTQKELKEHGADEINKNEEESKLTIQQRIYKLREKQR